MTEIDLLDGCLSEDADCQREMFRRYADRMMAVCLRYLGDRVEAEDVLQEAFIRVFDKLADFRREGSLEGWIRRIVINTALRSLRGRRPREAQAELDPDQEAPVPPAALAHLQEADLLKLVAALPPGYRTVFNLYAIEGYAHREIAALLDIAEGTSRSQLAKARQLLQKQLSLTQRIAV